VELIVVIVILGILLAIAIPALTGYIAKAQDEQYKMDARDAKQAVRTVLDEAYAKGELNSPPGHSDLPAYIQNGESGFATKNFQLQLLSLYAAGEALDYHHATSDLMGKTYPPSFMDRGTWDFYLVGPTSSTALSADGFVYIFYPDGDFGGPVITVTYRVQRVAGATMDGDILAALYASPLYSAEAGYEVYHLVF
jgi:type II secretory pathway pseudopilin PulG